MLNLSNVFYHFQGSSTSSSGPKLTPQERLKRKMQAALSRQLKADKEAEKVRQEKQDQERHAREESLRELTIKYRRRYFDSSYIASYRPDHHCLVFFRDRERRHRELGRTPSPSSESGRSTASLSPDGLGRGRSKSPF